MHLMGRKDLWLIRKICFLYCHIPSHNHTFPLSCKKSLSSKVRPKSLKKKKKTISKISEQAITTTKMDARKPKRKPRSEEQKGFFFNFYCSVQFTFWRQSHDNKTSKWIHFLLIAVVTDRESQQKRRLSHAEEHKGTVVPSLRAIINSMSTG